MEVLKWIMETTELRTHGIHLKMWERQCSQGLGCRNIALPVNECAIVDYSIEVMRESICRHVIVNKCTVLTFFFKIWIALENRYNIKICFKSFQKMEDNKHKHGVVWITQVPGTQAGLNATDMYPLTPWLQVWPGESVQHSLWPPGALQTN